MVSIRSDFWDHFFMFITFLGQWLVVLILFLFVSALFVKYKKKFLIKPLLISILGSGLTTILIKYLVNRDRPGGDIPLYIEKLPSFPSAHAALVLALFGFLIYCLWRFNLNHKVKVFFMVIFSLVILLIGFSRLYLGVHYLTDVLAGYLVGLIWVLISVYLSRKNLTDKRF